MKEALALIMWKTSFGRGYGPVVRQTAEWIKRRKGNCIGHMLHRNCLLQQVTEGKKQGRSDGKTRKNA